ncbi:hypothetical protein F2P81_018161 [Scophthalmus maximus]|uniref:Uncharacterized protein n=1 Tax=Scophthalmus maximus TaxID=52904 RepID=A0A6A4S1G1_SCOMX|nr:hypothetical protein F2P81_018161 [Scophthalmus maximus]
MELVEAAGKNQRAAEKQNGQNIFMTETSAALLFLMIEIFKLCVACVLTCFCNFTPNVSGFLSGKLVAIETNGRQHSGNVQMTTGRVQIINVTAAPSVRLEVVSKSLN